MTNQAMASYGSLCGNEIWNAARLKAYMDNGITPNNYRIRCGGCDGLDAILPCADSDPPANGYQLPELDDAPWYDPAVPESKNFAGLFVTSVTMSSPYARTVTQNIGDGASLGRLRLQGRTITVHGYLIGKTCCATQYGLRWLTSALGDPPCAGVSCSGCEFDFLDCCPDISGEDECITTLDAAGKAQVFIRPVGATEYQRGSDFFRRMNGVGIVSGVDVISCHGTSCGCGCGNLLEVEFVLGSESPYINSFGTDIISTVAAPLADCGTGLCGITWLKSDDCTAVDTAACPPADDCLDDPLCPLPALPPQASTTIPSRCGCDALSTVQLCSSVSPERVWGSSTLNVTVYAGSKDLRNLKIRVWQNPLGSACTDLPECDACSTLSINFVPAGGTLTFSGETRTVTTTCGNTTRNSSQNVTDINGQPFDWPDLTCVDICACVEFDCGQTATDATVSIERIDRDL